MSDKDTDAKLDTIAEHMKNIHDGVSEMRESHKALSARIDALEKGRSDSVDDPKAERERDDRLRRDGESEEDHARRLADIERRDRARRRVDSEEEERRERADRAAAVQAQMRADKAYQAWTMGTAPPRMAGEDLRDYRIRLLTPHRKHSKVYANSDLFGIADESAFATVEDSIINDAVTASLTTVVEGEPLRMITEKNEAGHTVRKFYGSPQTTWGPFMGGAVRVVKLQRPGSK